MSSRSENPDDAAQRMLAALPEAPALGRGPLPTGEFVRHDYHHPAAGWGAAESVGHVLERAGEPIDGFRALFLMNHEDGGFDCPGCAWPDDPSGLRLDLCENGVKHVTWELTRKQVGRELFAAHTVSELAGWSDGPWGTPRKSAIATSARSPASTHSSLRDWRGSWLPGRS